MTPTWRLLPNSRLLMRHTGGLEVYHNVRLKLLPKRTSYSLQRMIIGSMLIAIEVNRNLDTERREYWSYSKGQKKYVRKSRVLRKDYSFRKAILQHVIDFLEDGKEAIDINVMLKEARYIKRKIPDNIIGLDILEDTSLNRSRF